MKMLKSLNIDVKLNAKVTNFPEVKGHDAFVHKDQLYTLSDGGSVQADLAVVCVGSFHRKGNLVTAVNEKNQVFMPIYDYICKSIRMYIYLSVC